MKEKINEILSITLLFLVGIPLFILFLPVIIFFLIFDYFKIKRFKKKYYNYLLSIEGAKFFCYNNRKNNHHYIEKNIVSRLNEDIEYVFLEGRNLKTEYIKEYISHMLFNVSDRKGFPYLIKISNGKAIDKSINSQFHNFKSKNKNPEDLIFLINDSFNNLHSKIYN